ncbi:type VII secretion-associated serine protease mycosin [Streptomyces pacificus]|uniref:Type VII secretion-associated serine protease mycosin n=1 Tax=Streptomyces pacificus TaxID=2705029 RepID=A0A6A0AR52_9ACTN|nr:type VII secretion-associated serine protease mycosin [Streptomyces pacificus]GFH35386.1 type VII secretion-associated serine protease mycosin [Streptomyces pacificus]
MTHLYRRIPAVPAAAAPTLLAFPTFIAFVFVFVLAFAFAFVFVVVVPAAPAAADGADRCTYPGKTYEGRPWALQRVLLDELWKQSTGKGVRVAVIDTGVDVRHPQLSPAVDIASGRNLLDRDLKDAGGFEVERGSEDGTTDTVGHGTRVAGIIAARPAQGTGFVGLAPEATIIPIQQNDAEGHGTAETLARAVDHAVAEGAGVINISQDTAGAVEPTPLLKQAIDRALEKEIVVVASAGNDGMGGNVKKTYPASYEGVLAVASSDRNNERAAFSQSGDFVGVAAPGVDIVSTVPGGGHCADSGTSFSAPYAAAVAALIRSKHEDWTQEQIVAQIQQTAERSVAGHDRLVGWGVVDPVRALTEDDEPLSEPVAREGLSGAEAPTPAELHLGETADERNARLATYVVVGGAVLVAAIAGGAVTVRDARRRAGGPERGAGARDPAGGEPGRV